MRKWLARIVTILIVSYCQVNAKPPVVEKRSKQNYKKKPTGLGIKPKSIERQSANKILELGIFVDEAALALFMPYLGKGEYVKLRELVLVFVNGVRTNTIQFK